MTPALKAMVEAMKAEISRQVSMQMDTGPGAYPNVEVEEGWLVVFSNDGAFNLEKVARAGLEAIVDGERICKLDDDLCQSATRIIEAVQSARIPPVADMAALGESIGNYRQELLSFDAILKG